MESKILLDKIMRVFAERKVAKVENYSSFGFIKQTDKAVYVTREKWENTPVPFIKILIGIEAYQKNQNLYDEGPNALRTVGITHVTSPIWSLLHLLDKKDYKTT